MNDELAEVTLSGQEVAEVMGDNALAAVLFGQWDVSTIVALANHGADAGWSGLTYTSDLIDLYAAHADDLWDHYSAECESFGETIPLSLQGRRVESHADLCTWLVWFAAESLARDFETLVDDGTVAELIADRD